MKPKDNYDYSITNEDVHRTACDRIVVFVFLSCVLVLIVVAS